MSTKSDSEILSKDATSPPTTLKESDTRENGAVIADQGSSSTNRKNDLKKEELASEKANLTASRSMFEDVDGKNGSAGDVEMVDLSFEGIAEIDGVPHFVCQGECDDFDIEMQVTKFGLDLKIPQVPEPVIITRLLGDLFGNFKPEIRCQILLILL